MKKLLFLDVDGVLNNPEIIQARRSEFGDGCGLGEQQLTLLKAIVNLTGCEIVLSSTWRILKEHQDSLEIAFIQHQIPKWIGKTPSLSGGRFNEIQSWLIANDQDAQVAIVDDDPDAKVDGLFFVQTDFSTGLIESEAREIINFFQSGQKNFPPTLV